jgi:hypothetical protein
MFSTCLDEFEQHVDDRAESKHENDQGGNCIACEYELYTGTKDLLNSIEINHLDDRYVVSLE